MTRYEWQVELDDQIAELLAYPLPTFDTVATGAKTGGVLITEFPDAEHLLVPSPEVKCIGCSEPLCGIFGTFRWGLAHGEGYCTRCGWPARALHYVKIEGGAERTVEVVLQYSPDWITECVKRRKEKA